jgi:NAD-dependent deacetylase
MYKVLILSGAGLSAESGLKTFRDHDGMWENYDVTEVCSVEGFRKDRKFVNDFYDKRREDLGKADPNFAHRKIAELKKKYPNEIAVVTQNVDDLIERSGCSDVLHLHGTLTDLRCEICGKVWSIGYKSQNDEKCPNCDEVHKIRHNVVMFGEPAPNYSKLQKIIDEIEMFIVIGSSGEVLPLGAIARGFESSILNNLYSDETLDQNFTTIIHKPATEGILEIEKIVEDFLNIK